MTESGGTLFTARSGTAQALQAFPGWRNSGSVAHARSAAVAHAGFEMCQVRLTPKPDFKNARPRSGERASAGPLAINLARSMGNTTRRLFLFRHSLGWVRSRG